MKMRIRFKPWARPELEASKFYIDNPEEYKGKWKELFNNSNPIHIELGCGKGGFISNIAVYGGIKKNFDIIENKYIVSIEKYFCLIFD